MKAPQPAATTNRMVPKVTMRLALSDPRLLADAMVGDSWSGWRTLLIAAAGEALTDNERQEFQKLTGREREPGAMVSQFIAIFGRRAGKSVALAVFLVWIASLNDHRGTLKGLGEKGIALCVSRDQRVARVILGYVDGVLRNSKLLRGQIVKRTADTIELRNRISIEVRPCSSRTLRGPSYICVASDEVAFWQTATELMNPDVEIISSLMPALMTTGGPLLIASSVYSKVGLLYDSWRRFYGPDGPSDILVGFGSSRAMNPSLPQAEIDRELERDFVRNSAEYLSQWRDDVSGFLSREVVEACVSNYHELPPNPSTTYAMFIDAASGVKGGDSYTGCVAHRADDMVVIDKVVEVRAPFSPASAVADYIIPLARAYRISRIWGDNYAGQFPQEPIRLAGFSYERVTPNKSELFRDPFLSLINSGKLVLPQHPRLISQICSLERSVRGTAKEQIGHPIHGMDDLANSVAGAAHLVYSRAGAYDRSYSGFSNDPPPGVDQNTEQAKNQLLGYCNSMINGGFNSFGGGGRWSGGGKWS
jgi:hypothetical protein